MSDQVLPAEAAASPAAVGIRVLVVDADDRTRESMVGILGIRHRFTVIGNTGQASDAIALVRDKHPDIVIIDPRLPEVSGGVALIRRLRVIAPNVHILAIGWSPDLENAALTAGAHGFMRKTFKPADLASAVSRCLGDGSADLCDEPSPTPDRVLGPGLIV
ncbi:MAG TPA: response regulator transcription factor [Candidatus Limnocylindrales bacterium]|jgi:DNA-binding NarL/FixJ family response regulator